MPDWNIEKGIAITDATPTGDAGVKLNDNFERLRDESPFNTASDPTVNNDSGDGFFAGSQWFNTSSRTMWVCTDASSGAAVWKSLYRRDEDAIVLAPLTDGAVEARGESFAAGRLSGQLTMSPGTQGTGSQFIAGFQNELANWEDRGGTLTTSTNGGASLSTPQYVVQPQRSGSNTGTVSFTATGEATFTFTGLGTFPFLAHRGWGAYLLLRAGQKPTRIKVELQNADTDAWVTVWDDSSPVFRLNLWYSGIAIYPVGTDVDPKGVRMTLTYGSTSPSYIRTVGFYHQNRALGTYVFPYLYADNTFDGDNIFTGSVQVDNLSLDGNTLSTTETDGELILSPNGEGAIQRDSGGNPRGSYAIDLQISRTADTQVASGNCSFVVGQNCTASLSSSQAMGFGCEATGNFAHAHGYKTLASGGRSHAEGSETIASGDFSHAEGHASVAEGDFSYAGGRQSKAHLHGQWARSAGTHSGGVGTAQSTITLLLRRTTNATATELTLTGGSPSSATRFTILNGQTLGCLINIVGRKEDGGANDHAMFVRQVLIRREGSTTALVGAVQTVGTDINPAGWGGVTITADDTNNSLKIEVTGAASKNIRWTATVMASEAADAAI